MKQVNKETHHLLPSGEWEGFYCYSNSQDQHKMSITLYFSNAIVSGSGIDDVNTFTWNGTYDLTTFLIKMIKTYPTHTIVYKGDIDENGIWGIWENPNHNSQDFDGLPQNIIQMLNGFTKGGFHIWPKSTKSEHHKAEKKEAVQKSKKLHEIFIENF